VRGALPTFALAGLLCLAVPTPEAAAGPTLPTHFAIEDAVPGVTFQLPTCLAFLPDGRMLVGEKRGVVWIVAANGVRHPSPLWSRESEVGTKRDLGLMSIAVDPSFATNGRVYFLYTVDPDSNDVEDDPHAFGRLTRYTFSLVDSNALDPASRRILLGHDWSHGPVITEASHGVGSLRWGEDGSLFVSVGDGASFAVADAGGVHDGAFGPARTSRAEDIGAFRAQDWDSPNGKILRINPSSGAGYPSNPFYRAQDPYGDRSRVWAYGLRNPFRLCVRPGTGSSTPSAGDPGVLVVGDVGWTTAEEIDVVTEAGRNFGWPCYEGIHTQSLYGGADPSHHGCATIGGSQNPSPHTPPSIAWDHFDTSLAVPPGSGISGNCVIPGVFYTGSEYPPTFQGGLFFSDFGGNWLRVARLDANQQVLGIDDFGSGFANPVDFAAHPGNGDLHLVELATGTIRRIRYTGPGGTSPVATATGTPVVGTTPLRASFSATASFSPIGHALAYHWDFGDGATSTEAEPTHLFTQPGEYRVVLTVADEADATGRDTVHVVAATSVSTRFPSSPVVDGFDRENGPVGAAWIDELHGLEVVDGRLTQTGGLAIAVWGGASFGANQEAYFTLNALTANSPHHSLMLKVQGTSFANGHIQVRYKLPDRMAYVTTFAPEQGWVQRGLVAVTLEPGDQLGARAAADGTVEVFRNGASLGVVDAAGWPFHANGGRIGLVLQDGLDTRIDDFGGGDASGFPTTPILDDFDRADGPLGGAWTQDLTGLAVADSQLTHDGGLAVAVWGGGAPFGPNQEAWITFDAITASGPHHSLMLKVQGSYLDGHIQVRYKLPDQMIYVTTHAPGEGWVQRGVVGATLQPGDHLGARAYSNGMLHVYRNGVTIGTFDVAAWPYHAHPGRIGFVVQDGFDTRLDDFGGGTAAIGLNQPPAAVIESPQEGFFYARGDTIRLAGTAADPDHDVAVLAFQWRVDQIHNNHVHPGIHTTSGPTGAFVGEDHEDGTGSHLMIHLFVSDPAGGRDTAHVAAWPDVDLEPGPVVTIPATPATSEPADYGFWIHNRGRVRSPSQRWVLRIGADVIAQGDTSVLARDSVFVGRTLGPMAGAGTYALRAVVDTLGAVPETDEANNASTVTLVVVAGDGPDVLAPVYLEGPDVDAYGLTATVTWRTNEPAMGKVRFGTTPAFEDSSTTVKVKYGHRLLIHELRPSTRYYWTLSAWDTLGNFRSSPLDSFETPPGSVATEATLPVEFGVSGPRPNPSRDGATFLVDLPRPAWVRLTVYDLQGRAVSATSPFLASAGRVSVWWTGSASRGGRLAPGLYLARIELDDRTFVRRLIVVH
jgi:glucose/arabinose dehydrogenase